MLISLIRMSISRINGSCIPATRRDDGIGGPYNIIRQRCRERLSEIQPRPSHRRDEQTIRSWACVEPAERTCEEPLDGTFVTPAAIVKRPAFCSQANNTSGTARSIAPFACASAVGPFAWASAVGRSVANRAVLPARCSSLRRSAAGQGGTRARTVRYSAAGRRRYSSRSPSPDSSSPGSASGWLSPGCPRRR